MEPSPLFWTVLSNKIEKHEEKAALKWDLWKRLVPSPVPLAAAAVLVIGLFLGNTIGQIIYPNGSYSSSDEIYEALVLNTFDDLPSGSLGDAYASLLFEGEEQ